MRVSKLESASQALDAAIRLLFSNAHPVPVYLLAASGYNVLADLADHAAPENSWRGALLQDSGLAKRDFTAVLNRAWNFFKHAGRDPFEVLEFSATEVEHLLFVATLECGDLAPPSAAMQVFQIWYLAAHPQLMRGSPLVADAVAVLPLLDKDGPDQRLLRGKVLLEKYDRQFANT